MPEQTPEQVLAQMTEEKWNGLEATLLNTSGTVALHDRFRTLFLLKSLKSQRAVDIIAKGFKDPSALLKHELAYVLGQMGEISAVEKLKQVLETEDEDPMVRHEAAEALGALSAQQATPILQKYATTEGTVREVKETCEIALAKIEWDRSQEAKSGEGRDPNFTSIDPAPALASHSPLVSGSKVDDASRISTLRATLLDTKVPLFERYRAMFTLRNIGTPEAIDALADGFGDDSVLFKHEIAFVFGQMAHPHSIPALVRVLRDTQEGDMVRHEAAEALGAITSDEKDGQEVLRVLREWSQKEGVPLVVKQSCEVAIDMWEHENSKQSFQYATGLENVTAVSAAA
jgi:deoxyhypusine monooxygenase